MSTCSTGRFLLLHLHLKLQANYLSLQCLLLILQTRRLFSQCTYITKPSHDTVAQKLALALALLLTHLLALALALLLTHLLALALALLLTHS